MTQPVLEAIDIVKDQQKKKVLTLILMRQEPGRPVAVPPGVPADRVAALRNAFDETMKDKGFLDDAGKQKLEINSLTGEQLTELIADLMKTPPELSKKMESMTRR